MSSRVSIVAPLVAAFLAGGAGLGAQYESAEAPKVHQPRPGQPAPPERDRVAAQGFSVVLVVADLQASNAQDDVPPAARRALADMKDFLPYKSYKLVDAAWILGQGTSGTSTRLRGPEEQDYELRLLTNRAEAARVGVRFTLSDAGAAEVVVETLSNKARAEREREAVALRSQLQQVQREIQEEARRRERLSGEAARVSERRTKELQNQSAELQRRLEQTRRAGARTGSTSGHAGYTAHAGRTIIDTSFTMDVGETVVVGTSRLKSNSKALIALLTAVPPKGSRPPAELR